LSLNAVEVREKASVAYFDLPLWKRGIEGNGTYLSFKPLKTIKKAGLMINWLRPNK